MGQCAHFGRRYIFVFGTEVSRFDVIILNVSLEKGGVDTKILQEPLAQCPPALVPSCL